MNGKSAVHLGLRRGSGKRIFLRACLLLGTVLFAVTLIESFLVYKGLYEAPPHPIKKTAECDSTRPALQGRHPSETGRRYAYRIRHERERQILRRQRRKGGAINEMKIRVLGAASFG